LLGHLVTARASDSMFLFIDFVRVTNCFYDYDLRLHVTRLFWTDEMDHLCDMTAKFIVACSCNASQC